MHLFSHFLKLSVYAKKGQYLNILCNYLNSSLKIDWSYFTDLLI